MVWCFSFPRKDRLITTSLFMNLLNWAKKQIKWISTSYIFQCLEVSFTTTWPSATDKDCFCNVLLKLPLQSKYQPVRTLWHLSFSLMILPLMSGSNLVSKLSSQSCLSTWYFSNNACNSIFSYGPSGWTKCPDAHGIVFPSSSAGTSTLIWSNAAFHFGEKWITA